MKTINIKAHTTDNTQIDAIKAFMKALKIKFEVSKESPYSQEFVDKIEQGDKDFSNGLGEKMTIEDLNNLWK
jgi:hypothetical protein